MSRLMICGVCCMLVSGWGIIQLFIMGCISYIEAPIFLEESMPEEYGDYKDFISQTKTNFRKLAHNCWIAAGMYIATLLISYMCVKKAKSDAAEQAKLEEDDEYICNPSPDKSK